MSKQKLNNSSQSIIGLQSTYNAVECCLFHEGQLFVKSVAKEHASALLIPTLETLLEHHMLTLDQIGCIIVNKGPGPFTTLRTVIATANGINMATAIPLIGVNGMQAFLDEYGENSALPTIALLNAFHESVYYGIKLADHYDIGYMHIDNLLPIIQERYPENVIRFIGNGARLYKDKIVAYFHSQAYIPDPLPETASIKKIVTLGHDAWQKGLDLTVQITPIYLKKPVN